MMMMMMMMMMRRRRRRGTVSYIDNSFYKCTEK
jgi:hypothetical protein